MRTRIISAFPGTGKTYYHRQYPDTTLDSDSSQFSWIYEPNGEKRRHPNFPQNYIDHIKENIGKYEIIFVSTHEDVRNALKNNCLFFYLMYPSTHQKSLYIERYRERGSSLDFIKLIDENWDQWLNSLSSYTAGCKNIRITRTMEQEIQNMIAINW